MTLPSDWKMEKCLEWNTDLPSHNRPRISPVFLMQNVECHFRFSRIFEYPYYSHRLYLEPKTPNLNLFIRKFSLVIYSAYRQTFLAVQNATFTNAKTYVYSIAEEHLPHKESGFDFDNGCFMRFFFMFKEDEELQLHLVRRYDEKATQADLKFDEKATQADLMLDEKATQADLTLSLQTDMEHLSLDLGELLKKGSHSDVQLLCNGGNIPAHRAVLAARSKVFSDMLQNNTEESKNGLINFSTTDFSSMELCLEFIYNGKILNLPVEMTSHVYVLGNILKISSLTKMCADLMITLLSEDNYISYLILADKYNDDYLKSGITNYIFHHLELLKSENWIKFSDKCLKMANDVYRKVVYYQMCV